MHDTRTTAGVRAVDSPSPEKGARAILLLSLPGTDYILVAGKSLLHRGPPSDTSTRLSTRHASRRRAPQGHT